MLREQFKQIIDTTQRQMRLHLEEIRATFQHKGVKGDKVEDSVRQLLRRYLPTKFQIGKGEVVDTTGQRSAQTDVVVVDDYHPFTFTDDEPSLFFIEGVCVAGEVKSLLTSQELTQAVANSQIFKKLSLSKRLEFLAAFTEADSKRYYMNPPWFLLAFESQLTLETINERLRQGMLGDFEINRQLDAVFVLDRGWVINFGDGTGSFKFTSTAGVDLAGWVTKETDAVLFDLMAWLSAVIPHRIILSSILPLYMLPGERPHSGTG
jgi:hypothetical protein